MSELKNPSTNQIIKAVDLIDNHPEVDSLPTLDVVLNASSNLGDVGNTIADPGLSDNEKADEIKKILPELAQATAILAQRYGKSLGESFIEGLNDYASTFGTKRVGETALKAVFKPPQHRD